MTSRTLRLCTTVLLVLAVVGFAAAAMAETAVQQAKRHNDEATKQFNLGQFEQAAENYKQAYQAKPLPVFLHNIAQCYKRMAALDSLEKALFYFESYLSNAPRAADRADVEAEIAELKRQIAQLRRSRPHAAEDAPTPTPSPTTASETDDSAPPASKPLYKKWWFWTTAAAVVTLGMGVGLGLASNADYSDAERLGAAAADRDAWNDAKSSGEAKELAANVSFGLAGGFAVAAGVLLVLEEKLFHSEKDTRVSRILLLPTIDRPGASIAIGF